MSHILHPWSHEYRSFGVVGMPKLNTNVFVKASDDVGTQDLDGIGIELTKGAVYYLPYRSIRTLISDEADKVALM